MNNPLEALLITTLHRNFDDYPWIGKTGIQTRLIHVRPDQNLAVMQIRAQPGVGGGKLHRHTGPVLGLTTRGAWGHDPSVFPYQANSYICEPDELHRFYNGSEISEVFYINLGQTEFYDESGREVIGRETAKTKMERYLQGCEEQGLPRPNVMD